MAAALLSTFCGAGVGACGRCLSLLAPFSSPHPLHQAFPPPPPPPPPLSCHWSALPPGTMDALRSIDTPDTRRVCAAVSAATLRERKERLASFDATPGSWHALLAGPGVAAALAADVSAAVRHVRSHRRSSTGATGVDVSARTISTLCAVILAAARRCAAADDALADALVAGLVDVCPAQDVQSLACFDGGRAYMGTVDLVLAWVCDAALKLPSPTAERELGGCDDGPNTSPSGGNAYTAARARVARLASNRELLRWSMELQRETVRGALAGQERRTADPQRVSPREALVLWATMAPRQLLAAVPGVLQQLLESIERLAGTRSDALFPLLVTSMMALQQLADVDPPRLRAQPLVPVVPRVMAAVATYLMGAMSREEGPPDPGFACIILPLVALYAPGHGSAMAMADCEELLGHFVRWALQPMPSPVEGRGPFVPLSSTDESVPVIAASMLLYVAREALCAGRDALPLAFRCRAARAGWRRLATCPNQPALAAVGAQLEALASRSTRSRAGTPTPFPFEAAARVEWARRCWTCGCPYRQPLHRREQLLRKCAACKVAAYCGAACASTGWAADHRSTCAGWRAYQAAAGAQGGGGGAPPVGHHPGEPLLLAAAQTPFPVDLSGDWKTDWGWTVTLAARVLDAGLSLTDVVVVVELGMGRAEVLPAVEYAHRPDAVPADMLSAAAAKHDGRVLRVVVRQHPPLLRSYGPRSLQLDT